MIYTIKINCNTTAFECQPGIEVARMLRKLACKSEDGGEPYVGAILDINGNAVGTAKVSSTKH